MTVQEAIDILQTLPKNSLIAAHASNHTTSDEVMIAEGVSYHYGHGSNVPTVFIGNFTLERMSGNSKLNQPAVLHKGKPASSD